MFLIWLPNGRLPMRMLSWSGLTATWGSQVTMKYPAVYLKGERARGEVLSIAYSGAGQHQTQMPSDSFCTEYFFKNHFKIHCQRRRTDFISGTRTNYAGAKDSSSYVSCDALLLDPESRSDTYPTMRIKEQDVEINTRQPLKGSGRKNYFICNPAVLVNRMPKGFS